MQIGSFGTLIGWKFGQIAYFPLWNRMEGSWLLTVCKKKGLGELPAYNVYLDKKMHFLVIFYFNKNDFFILKVGGTVYQCIRINDVNRKFCNFIVSLL